MSALHTLQHIQLDALRETANIGAGHAATALSQMTGSTIMIKVPAISIVGLGDLPAQFSPEEEPAAAVFMRMLGDLTGRTLLVFPRPTVARLTELMLRHVSSRTAISPALEQSAIQEAGNILSGAYMNALSDFLGMLLLPSPPSIFVDRSAVVLTRVFGEEAEGTGSILCVESEFLLTELDQTLRGYFLLLPDQPSLHVMLRALRLA